MPKTEVAIIGLGAMGALSAWRLADRGASVVAFERFRPGHKYGSSHGDTRIIRSATRGPDYVPWAQQSFQLWKQLEQQTRAELLTETGALLIGRPEGRLVEAGLARSRQYGLKHRLLDNATMERLHPRHRLSKDEVGVFEELAGFLRPEASITAAVSRAESLGAQVMVETEVISLESSGSGVVIDTSRGRFAAERLVVTVGAWTPKLLPRLGLALKVERQVLAWLAVDDAEAFGPKQFPVFTHELPGSHIVYGFPTTNGSSVKVAVHHDGSEADPDTIDREVHEVDLDPVREYAKEHLRGVGRVVDARVCMYTNAPDGRFFATSPTELPGALVINACNGDGFKFAAVIGELVADFILEDRALPALLETIRTTPA